MASNCKFNLFFMLTIFTTLTIILNAGLTRADLGIGMGPSKFSLNVEPGKDYFSSVIAWNPGDYDIIASMTSTCPSGWVTITPNAVYLNNHTSTSNGIPIQVKFSIPNDATSGVCNCVIGLRATWSSFGQIGMPPAVSSPVTLNGVSCPQQVNLQPGNSQQANCQQKWVCTDVGGQNISSWVNSDCTLSYQTLCTNGCDSSGICSRVIETSVKTTPTICGPQFALIIALTALGASMIMWGLDKMGILENYLKYLGWLYIIIGLLFALVPAILLFFVHVC